MKKQVLSVAALFAIGILGFSVASAGGFSKGMWKGATDEEREAFKERHSAIRNAVETGDYDTWATLMNDHIEEMRSMINEETFETMQEKHQMKAEFKEAMKEARETGNWTRALELKEEYGFDERRGYAHKQGWKHHKHMNEVLIE